MARPFRRTRDRLAADRSTRHPRPSFKPAVEPLEEHLALSQVVAGAAGEVYFLSGRQVFYYNDSGAYQDTHSPLARSGDSGLSVGSSAYLLGADNVVWRDTATGWVALTSAGSGPQNVKQLIAGQKEAFALDGSNQLWVYQEPSFYGNYYFVGGWARTAGNGHDMSLGSDRYHNDELWILGWGSNGYGNDLWRYDRGTLGFTGGYVSQVYAGHEEAFAFTSNGWLWQAFDQAGQGLLNWNYTGLGDGRWYGHEFSLARGSMYGFDEAWFKDGGGSLWNIDESFYYGNDNQASLMFNYEGLTALTGLQAGHNRTVYGTVPGTGHVYGFAYGRTWDTGLAAGSTFTVGTPLAAAGGDEVWAVSLQPRYIPGWGITFQPELSYYSNGYGTVTATGVWVY